MTFFSTLRKRATVASSLILLCSGAAQAQHVLTTAQAEQFAKGSFPEYLELLSMPNDAANAKDIQRNAAWLEQAFAKRGFKVGQLANGERPAVFAEWGEASPQRKTILFYMHFDGQPVVPGEWKTDPWTPVLKARDAQGQWQTLPLDRLAGALDPEWRVFARASADDKGPITMFLAAIDALQAAGRNPDVHVKVLLDSEEEKGSPHLHLVMRDNAERLRSDGLVILDGAMPPGNKPGVNFGNRGSVQVDLTVFGPNSAPHSGTYGNVVPNPALRLAGLLDSMKDAQGRVVIPGFYDRVQISASDRLQMARSAPVAGTFEQRFGIAQLDAVGSNPVEAVQYPSLDILGFSAGRVGNLAANAIPSTATASLNIRTVPETPPDFLYGLVRQHIQNQGFHIVEGREPSADERSRYGKLVSVGLTAYPSTSTGARLSLIHI
mgnify:FL=1